MRVLFIADLHLQASRPDITQALLAFLHREAPHSQAIYILGDLFEAWVGDDAIGDLEHLVAEAFRKADAAGCRLFFLHGNRDFLLGETFARSCCLTLLPETARIDLGGQPALLMHGDSLCLEDQQYQAFRAQVRDRQWQQLLLEKPLAERLRIAQQLRAASQQANREKSEQAMDVSPGEVERVLSEQGARILIHGHTHRPAMHQIQVTGTPAQRLVVGDWDQEGWVLSWTSENGFALTRFELKD